MLRAHVRTTDRAYSDIVALLLRVKNLVDAKISEYSGNAETPRRDVFDLRLNVRNFRVALTDLAQTPRVIPWAQVIEDDPAYDPTADFVALGVAMDAFVDDVAALFPDELMEQPDSSPAGFTNATFTSAQLVANVNPLLAAIGALITITA